MGRTLKLIAILAFASLAVTACGKRGTLEAPAATDGEVVKKKAETKETKDPRKMVKAKPEDENGHRDFVLDGLLR